MKKAIIVHCWEGSPEYCWYPYVKRELELKGYQVEVPFFPDMFPLLSKWVEKIDRVMGVPDQNTVLVGHSLGSVAVLRYLESLPPGHQVGGAVLVSGFVSNLGLKLLANFFRDPWDFQTIKSRAREFVLIASGEDPYISPEHTGLMKDNLDARVIWMPGGHFTEWQRTEYKEFPEVVRSVEEIMAHVEGVSKQIFKPEVINVAAQGSKI
jgi:uncharacterized protein